MGKINHKKILKEAVVQQGISFFVLYFVIHFLQGHVDPLFLTLAVVIVNIIRYYVVRVYLKSHKNILGE